MQARSVPDDVRDESCDRLKKLVERRLILWTIAVEAIEKEEVEDIGGYWFVQVFGNIVDTRYLLRIFANSVFFVR